MVSDPKFKSGPPGGSVLVADPELEDPNFHKTLIYLMEHNDEGSFGFVINRPSELTLEKLIPEAPCHESLKSIQIYNGGPVKADRLFLCCFSEQENSSKLICRGISSLEQAIAYRNQDDTLVTGFLGSAGWGRGQLDMEMRQGSWTTTRLYLEMFNPTYSTGVWALAREEDYRWRKMIPFLPDDPMQN